MVLLLTANERLSHLVLLMGCQLHRCMAAVDGQALYKRGNSLRNSLVDQVDKSLAVNKELCKAVHMLLYTCMNGKVYLSEWPCFCWLTIDVMNSLAIFINRLSGAKPCIHTLNGKVLFISQVSFQLVSVQYRSGHVFVDSLYTVIDVIDSLKAL